EVSTPGVYVMETSRPTAAAAVRRLFRESGVERELDTLTNPHPPADEGASRRRIRLDQRQSVRVDIRLNIAVLTAAAITLVVNAALLPKDLRGTDHGSLPSIVSIAIDLPAVPIQLAIELMALA